MFRYIYSRQTFSDLYKCTNKKSTSRWSACAFFKESKTVNYSVFYLSFASNSALIMSSLPFLLTTLSGVGLLFGFIFGFEFGVDYILTAFSFNFSLWWWWSLLRLGGLGGGRLLLSRFFVKHLAQLLSSC